MSEGDVQGNFRFPRHSIERIQDPFSVP